MDIHFKSLSDTDYTIVIGDEGTETPAYPAREPFVTQEYSSGDLFTPVRVQTGYIRLVTTNDFLETVIPSNNLEMKVTLKRGGSPVWNGFLCADGYSQPWDGGNHEIELPIKSVLAALYDSTIDQTHVGQLMTMGSIIAAGLTSIGYPNYPVSNIDDNGGEWSGTKVNCSVFFHKEEIRNQGDVQTAYFGKSYGEIIEDICRLFGLMCRDSGTGIIFTTYDAEFTFNEKTILSEPGEPGEFVFKGSNNQQGFIQGARDAVVRLAVGDVDQRITFPPVAETSTTPVQLTVNDAQTIFVQIHNQRVNQQETYKYTKYVGQSSSTPSTYEEMLNKCLLNGYSPNPYFEPDEILVTGAFPVRWFLQRDASTLPQLVDGLYMQTQYFYLNYNSPTPDECYSLQSIEYFSLPKGYLNIDLNLYCFALYNSGLIFTDPSLNRPMPSELYVAISVGGLFWNNADQVWESGTALSHYFKIFFDGETLRTNKTTEIISDKSTGFFIPVDNLKGQVKLYILDTTSFLIYYGIHSQSPSYAKILSNIEVEYIPHYELTASTRSENVYRQTILSGFSQTKDVNLEIGTMNNNVPTDVFLKLNDSTYIESLAYGAQRERPEMHLLGRLANYYRTVRRTLKAVVDTAADLYSTLYKYNGHVYFGVDAEHQWASERRTVKFIEAREDSSS